MTARLRQLGIVLTVVGLVFAAGGAFAFIKTQEGYRSLNAFSAAQNVTLSLQRSGPAHLPRRDGRGARPSWRMLTNEWGYPVVAGDLNPNDPVVNTGSEYMYQMATVAYHTLHGTQTVVLDENYTAPDGTVYTAGTEYQVPVAGRYWADFDRTNPVDAAVRAQAWTGVAHALIGELGVGTVTASALQMGLGLAGLFAGVGFVVHLRRARPGLGRPPRAGEGPGAQARRRPWPDAAWSPGSTANPGPVRRACPKGQALLHARHDRSAPVSSPGSSAAARARRPSRRRRRGR